MCQYPSSPHFGQTKRTAMSISLTLTSELLSESKWAFPLWINWPPHKRFLLLNCWCKQPKLCSTFFLSQCYFCRMIFCIFQHFLGNLKSVRFLGFAGLHKLTNTTYVWMWSYLYCSLVLSLGSLLSSSCPPHQDKVLRSVDRGTNESREGRRRCWR